MHLCQDQTIQGAFLGLREMLNVFGGNRHEYASAAMAELSLLVSVSPLTDGIY